MYKIFITIIFVSLYIYANDDNTISTLLELQQSKTILSKEIKIKTAQKNKTKTKDEKVQLESDIERLNNNLNRVKTKFETIASGIDISLTKPQKNSTDSSLSEDFHLLIKPLIESAKKLTKDMRKKATLQEEMAYYNKLLPEVAKAYANVTNILHKTKDKKLKKELLVLQKHWEQEITLISNNLNASHHQIKMLEKNSISFSKSLQKDTKNFFQKRGRFLLEGFIAFFVVLILMQLIYILSVKIFPILTR